MNKNKLIDTLNKTTSQLQSRPKCKCWNSGEYIKRKMRECLDAGGSFSANSDVSKCKPSSYDKCGRGNCKFNLSCSVDIPHLAPFAPGTCKSIVKPKDEVVR